MSVSEYDKEPFQALQDEFAGERAQALSRIAARMEGALAELREFDGRAMAGGEVSEDRAPREDLVSAAAEWVWFYVIQREVMGWYRHDEAMRFYEVPPEVLARLGPRRRK